MVFAMNTIVGFACAIGVDMRFNSKHHHEDKATEAVVHVHPDGKRHVHEENKESHSHGKSNHHDQANNQKKSGNENDNCCNDKVTKFEQLDKSVPNSLTIINPVFFVALVSSFYNIDVLFASQWLQTSNPLSEVTIPPYRTFALLFSRFKYDLMFFNVMCIDL